MKNSFITTLLLDYSRSVQFFDIGGVISKFVVYYDAYATLPQEEMNRGR